jgi:hypothetical protein
VWAFQKNGIVVRGAASTNILNNTVIGLGPTNLIAQNGIEVGLGANATIQSNTVFGMSYTGTGDAAGAGILLFGGPCYDDSTISFIAPPQSNTDVSGNQITASDIGIWSNNFDSTCTASVTTPTKNNIVNNSLRNNSLFNISGSISSTGNPYQAGISDQGTKDKITTNSICGLGYTPNPPGVFSVDVTLANSALAVFNGCSE